jgi:hypothetical protein
MWVRGDIGAFSAGPLTLEEAKLDLTMTPEDQHLIIKGDATLFSLKQQLDVEIDKTQLRFNTRTELFNMFTASLNAQAAFDLRQPNFVVDGVVESDMGLAFGPVVQQGALQFANASVTVIAGAQTAVTALRQTLSNAEATVDQLRTTLEQQRALAQSRVTAAASAANAALAAANSARARRDNAYWQWAGMSSWYPVQKASAYAVYVAESVRYGTLSASYAALAATTTAAQRVLDALPPVDQNILLLAADEAARVLRARLATAADNLDALSTQFNAIIETVEAGYPVLVISRASFHADLASLTSGASISWNLVGSFARRPFDIAQSMNFASLHTGGAQLLTALLGQ